MAAFSQRPNLGNIPGLGNRLGNIRSGNTGGGSDSLKHRDRNEDSITIYYRYLDSTRRFKLDSSINDFSKRFPIPSDHIFLGNTGTATHSILFSPSLKPGWDPGFHAFDVYKWKLESVRFFNTTRPYSELNYLLASKLEQLIEVFHTQNIKPNWNFFFNYRLTNSPGTFTNQNTAHNNYLLTSWYEGKKKRYNNYFVILANHLQSGENGGIVSDTLLKNTEVYKNRYDIPTQIGGTPKFTTDFFGSKLGTGNRYREFTFYLRQQYDLGKKDSIVTDSTVIPLFYPRLRFEYSFSYNTYKYQFFDIVADSAYYRNHYDITLHAPPDTLRLKDMWKSVSNDFSIYQFPDAKNQQQFIKFGATLQSFKGMFKADTSSFYNIILHGEYRNKTRNQKWDAELYGNLYTAGFNSGDYNAHITLKRYVGKKNTGYAEVGFENVNRSPSFLFDTRSSFYFDTAVHTGFKKENSSHIFASLFQQGLKLKLSGDYYLISNYTYFTDYSKIRQYEPLFNVLRISAQKIFKLGKHWNWYADVYLQKETGAVPVNMPLIYTRNRVAFEGLFFRNLNLSTGVEIKYNTPYKPDGYSPVLGQFFYQDSLKVSNMPEIDFFAHFRIRSFKGFLRFENLNSAQVTNAGFGWTNNRLGVPGYPYSGLQFRFGVWWSFVN